MRVMVTGGAGYIGSHAVKVLLDAGVDVLVVDNLERGHAEAIERVRALPGVGENRLAFQQCDVGEAGVVGALLSAYQVKTVLHFAALAYVGESVTDPLRYYRANTSAALALLRACDSAGVERFIFSSTCASFGEPPPDRIPIAEDTPQHPINPYGRSKLMVEHILADHAHAARLAGKPFSYACLRYFNVAGADPDGVIGEAHDPETHLIPIVLQVALGQRDAVTIFGTDYPTPDGTCVRDYVHVIDLIDAHLAVMKALQPGEARYYNVGIGRGYSVREIIEACRRVTGRPIEATEGERRPGDPPELYNAPAKIRNELGWEAKYTNLDEIIASAWAWHSAHPSGYANT
ncbi:MAG: UDP-glucose 4-epimerase GalE [Planctomycetota bacterium]